MWLGWEKFAALFSFHEANLLRYQKVQVSGFIWNGSKRSTLIFQVIVDEKKNVPAELSKKSLWIANKMFILSQQISENAFSKTENSPLSFVSITERPNQIFFQLLHFISRSFCCWIHIYFPALSYLIIRETRCSKSQCYETPK